MKYFSTIILVLKFISKLQQLEEVCDYLKILVLFFLKGKNPSTNINTIIRKLIELSVLYFLMGLLSTLCYILY